MYASFIGSPVSGFRLAGCPEGGGVSDGVVSAGAEGCGLAVTSADGAGDADTSASFCEQDAKKREPIKAIITSSIADFFISAVPPQ
jgi:hypothetical protein